MSDHKQPSEAQLMFAFAEMERHKTRHFLHLLLSIVTVGLWLIPWLAISVRNTQRRNRIAGDYGLPRENYAGLITVFILLIAANIAGVYQIYLTLTPETASPINLPVTQQTLPETHWTYTTEKDATGLGTIFVATTYSLNEIEFSPPNNGKQHAVLVLRHYSDNAHEVYLGLKKGQFKCDTRTCIINARFDNGLTEYIKAKPKASDETPGLLLNDADIFIQFAEDADSLVISAPFIEEPSQQTFQFDIRGLRWE